MKTIGFHLGHKHFIPHAKLLIHSIRQLNNIYSKKTIYIMNSSGVALNSNEVNVKEIIFRCPFDYLKIPFYDKVLGASILESNISDQIIWLDIDSILLKEPDAWRCNQPNEISLAPVDHKNIGLLSNSDLDFYWKYIYELTQSKPTYNVRTKISNELIKPYYNIGMVIVDSKHRIFTQTITYLNMALKNNIIQNICSQSYPHLIFLHQALFSSVVLKNFNQRQINNLSPETNIPLHMIKSANYKKYNSIRYDNYFNENDFPDFLNKKFKSSSEDLKMIWYY